MWLKQTNNLTSHSSQRERYRGDGRQAASAFKEVPHWWVIAFLPTCHLLTFNQMATLSDKGDGEIGCPLPSHISCKTLAWESLLLMKGENGYWEQLPSFASHPPIIHLSPPSTQNILLHQGDNLKNHLVTTISTQNSRFLGDVKSSPSGLEVPGSGDF